MKDIKLVGDKFEMQEFECKYNKFHNIEGRILKNTRTGMYYAQVFNLTMTDWYFNYFEKNKGKDNKEAEAFKHEFNKAIEAVGLIDCQDGVYIAIWEGKKEPTKNIIVKNLTKAVKEINAI